MGRGGVAGLEMGIFQMAWTILWPGGLAILLDFFLDSEWNDECIDFTMMCGFLFFYLFLCLCTR